jgi:2-oxoglutarate ferredoxin oxidoreductase subunit alpha
MSKVKNGGLIKPGVYFMRGNDACVEGALIAGCRFYGGYPITPSNEIATLMSRRLPQVGGYFIQFEDEIGSVMGVLGAANGGVKSMTATSGPGFSLMQESIGLSAMTETPLVIVNVQRGGPSTGLPTQVGQGDFMQTRWGSHGDYSVVAYLPNSSQEMFDLTIVSFNTAWKYRIPVVLLTDQMVGHMTEKVVVPSYEDIELIDRVKPDVPPDEFLPFDNNILIPPMAIAGEGYRVHVTGLAHNEKGYPTTDHDAVDKLVRRLVRKVKDNEKDIAMWEEFQTDDAKLVLIAFGITSRSAMKVVRDGRREGYKIGLFRPKTGWPFPYWRLQELSDDGADFLVVEINMGQMVNVVREHIKASDVYHMSWAPGTCPPPEAIFSRVREVYKK